MSSIETYCRNKTKSNCSCGWSVFEIKMPVRRQVPSTGRVSGRYKRAARSTSLGLLFKVAWIDIVPIVNRDVKTCPNLPIATPPQGDQVPVARVFSVDISLLALTVVKDLSFGIPALAGVCESFGALGICLRVYANDD